MILPTEDMHISRSLAKTIRSNRYQITCNTAFADVISACSEPRPPKNKTIEPGTWITPAMKDAYLAGIPAGRWGVPQDVADAALYFASEEASFVSGQTLCVNGAHTPW